MGGESLAFRDGVPALAGHDQADGLRLRRIYADEQGGLKVDAGVKSMSFTWNGDNTVNTIDIVKVVNAIDITKRVTFTWTAGKLQSVLATIV